MYYLHTTSRDSKHYTARRRQQQAATSDVKHNVIAREIARSKGSHPEDKLAPKNDKSPEKKNPHAWVL